MTAGRHALLASLCAVVAGLAGCETRLDPNTTPDPTVGVDVPPPPDAPVEREDVARDPPPPAATMTPAQEIATLENRLRMMDADGDDMIDRDEAESFYRWRFDELDDNGDGELSRAELQVEFPGVPDAETAIEELVGVSRDEYARTELERFGVRADATGMMSTADFHDMVGAPGALKRDWPP